MIAKKRSLLQSFWLEYPLSDPINPLVVLSDSPMTVTDVKYRASVVELADTPA